MALLNRSRIPIFFHIPKCAGTYAIVKQLQFMRTSYLDLIDFDSSKRRDEMKVLKNIEVYQISNGARFIVARVLAFDFEQICDLEKNLRRPFKEDLTYYTVDLPQLTVDFLKRIQIHSVVIKARGFSIRDQLFQTLSISGESVLKWIL